MLSQDTWSMTQPGWLVSLWWLAFLQIALTMSSVAMVADENMYAGFFFFLAPPPPPPPHHHHPFFCMRNIKNWIISVSMVTSEYRRGNRALYFATDARLYLKERDILWEGRGQKRGGWGGVWGRSSLDTVQKGRGKRGLLLLKSASGVWSHCVFCFSIAKWEVKVKKEECASLCWVSVHRGVVSSVFFVN